MLEAESPYHKASYPGLPGLMWKIARSTMVVRAFTSDRLEER